MMGSRKHMSQVCFVWTTNSPLLPPSCGSGATALILGLWGLCLDSLIIYGLATIGPKKIKMRKGGTAQSSSDLWLSSCSTVLLLLRRMFDDAGLKQLGNGVYCWSICTSRAAAQRISCSDLQAFCKSFVVTVKYTKTFIALIFVIWTKPFEKESKYKFHLLSPN